MIASQRNWNWLGVGICAGLMAYALYLQYVAGLEPCPLCVFQRVGVIAIGVVFLLLALHDPAGWGRRVYAALGGVAALFAGIVAGRHAWLQQLPEDQVPACGPGLDYILDAFPLAEALRLVFTGSGECADVQWSFLGLSMPAWVLVWSILLGVGLLAINWPRKSFQSGSQGS